jgi:hypothetical protein
MPANAAKYGINTDPDIPSVCLLLSVVFTATLAPFSANMYEGSGA